MAAKVQAAKIAERERKNRSYDQQSSINIVESPFGFLRIINHSNIPPDSVNVLLLIKIFG
jgi:hypothetical protein